MARQWVAPICRKAFTASACHHIRRYLEQTGMMNCKACNQEKEIIHFYKDGIKKSGARPYCLTCRIEIKNASKRAYRQRPDIKEIIKIKNKEYSQRPEVKARNAARPKKPLSEDGKARKRKLNKTPEKKQKRKEYLLKPDVRERTLLNRKARYHAKTKHDLGCILDGRIRVTIRRSLKSGKNNRSWRSLVDFDILQLKAHLEKQFTKGMSWEAFSAGEIEIDHIIPIKSFNISGIECKEFKACWSLANLRPLWKKENNSKRDKLIFLV